ncbi:putative retrotransposon hot spot protein (RHS) [Trypanosoma cruzi]|uniref:Putative retrotransposon hot spot protein (RHS) n=1 Tax=Trypanosoma cruzi TaxID=5693 RepID=A0A2V2VU25_TRYCR|nr:putative retrotransposon hot spot protein (RHS) [Trypanosoma cruzi]
MQYERRRHGTLLSCTPQIFSIKHASCSFFCCVGDYRDASLLWRVFLGVCMWSLLHRILLHFFVFLPGFMRAFHLAKCVRWWRCHTGAGRGERYAWTNSPCAPRCYYCLPSPTRCWVDDIHSPSLRWSSCIWLLSNTAWMTLLLWLRFMTVPIVFLFLIFHVGWLLFRSNSN